ncbi:AAA family ATPase [Helicobacter pylori]|uniref:AAA family ATPase n=1 Tax=Helicobacter pylori TaxID=210 RepID=UPI00359A9431
MKFYKRVLKLHRFRNLGKNLPAELLLNSSFEKHGGLVILVGENNVGKSNVLEALKIFNDADVKLCSEEYYFKAHESEGTILSLEEETILDHKITGFSCVDLKIRSKEIGEGLKELSKTLISYPFEKHVEALGEQCNNSVSIPINNNDYSNICTFVSNFTNFTVSYDQLKPFLHFYKEKLKLSELVTEYANVANNLLFKELVKHLSGSSELIKTFCQCIKEIIKSNTPNKKCNSDDFFVMGEHKQNQLAKIYSHFEKLSKNEIKPKDVEYISKRIEALDEIFKDSNTKFTPKIEVLQNKQSQERPSELIKDIIKEIDEKYPINENFKQQFEEFELNVKKYDEARKDFERRKESLIREIDHYCKNQKTLEFNDDVFLDNIQQTCKEYVASHVVNDEPKDVEYMMCQYYLEKMELLSNSKIRRYQYNDLLKSAKISLWESIKILDNESGARLFPKNLKEIKEKFEANKEKFKQSKNYYEFAEHCRECNPYTAFQDLRNRVNFPLKDHSLDEFVPNMREYKELKITDNDLKTTLFTFFDYSSPSEFNQSDWFFRNSLFRKIDFNPYDIWKNLNLDDKKDFAEILKYNMQSRIDSLIAKEFNKLLAIAQDSPQDNYQLKIRVRHNNKFFGEKYAPYEIKLEIHDCRKSDNQKPIILSEQSSGFQWAFNFMFGFLYNVGSNFSFNHNIIYVMDEPATHLIVPARKEFRKFLKEYAHKNHVTFVLATHDPFLVDTDHLDEIRIVEKEAEGSAIKNNFNYPLNNASKDSDALYQIKRSLGVGQHVFHNPKKHRIIFVEGITDYCYLSAFKLYFNKHNPQYKDNPIPFTFLPISGLKNNPNEMKETLQKLCELDNNPIVLTDDDRKDGSDPQKAKSEQFKKANEEMLKPITILQLSNCDEKFKQIEDCFSEKDKKEYARNKQRELAMAFKTRLLYSGKDDVMSEETKKNFQKLFEWIAWITNLIKC